MKLGCTMGNADGSDNHSDEAPFTNDSPGGGLRVLRVLPRRSRRNVVEPGTNNPLEPNGRRPVLSTGDRDIPILIRSDPLPELDSMVRRTSKRRRLDSDTPSTLGSGSSLMLQDDNFLTPPSSSNCCGNCGTTQSSRWSRSKLLLVPVCRPCYRYENKYCKSRPTSLAERARARADISAVIQCANCASVQTTNGWHTSKILDSANICSACDHYERRHSKCRPLELAQKPRRTVDPECGNCGSHTSSKNEWLRSALLIGHKVCSTCYAYERKHSKCRPLSLIRRAEERLQSQTVTECGNCRRKTSADSIWHTSILQPRVKLCQACDAYERRTGTTRPESLNQRKLWRLTKCDNCGERKGVKSSMDGDGKTLCDECAAYYLANGFTRPLSKAAIQQRRGRIRRERHRTSTADVPPVPTISGEPSTAPRRVCSNCHSTTATRGWGDSVLELDWTLCRACKQYELRHNEHRPPSVIKPARLHPPKGCCSNCGTAESQWRGRWNRSVLTPGWIICHVCKAYERPQKRHRPKRLWKRAGNK